MAAAMYPHGISSVHENNPTLPAVLGNLDLNQAIQEGTPINRINLVHANAVAVALKGIRESGDEPLVTDVIVESAELRATVIQNAHANAQYAPLDLAAEIRTINRNIQTITDRLDALTAASQNHTLRSRNERVRPPQRYSPLQKTISGHGLAKAQAVASSQQLRQQLAAPVNNPAVGTTPPNFNADIFNYQHIDILNLILFYNDDFGIAQGENIGTRIEKFRDFLVHF